MLGQRNLLRQTCGSTAGRVGGQRIVVSRAFKRNKQQQQSRPGYADPPANPGYSLPPIDPNGPPPFQQQQPAAPPQQQQQQQQAQRPAGAPQQQRSAPAPLPPSQPGWGPTPVPAQPPTQPGWNNYNNNQQQQPGFVNVPAAAPPQGAPAQNPAPAQGPPAGGFGAPPQGGAAPQQQQQQQQGGFGNGYGNGGWQQLPPQQQQGGYMQPNQQQQQGGYMQQANQQQQRQQQQQQKSWADAGGFVDQGGYMNDGGYMDGRNEMGGYVNTPQRSGWNQQGGNGTGYYKNNRNQQQQNLQSQNYLDQGGYMTDNGWGQQTQRRAGFAGFDAGGASPAGPWMDDYLLQALDSQIRPNQLQMDVWQEEVEVEEDMTPKYVNGNRVLVNSEIEAPQVRVQDASKADIGVMTFEAAREMSIQQDVDVVMINKEGDPPVVRLISFSKYKYELEKSAKQKQKASKGPEIKEVKLRPVTEKADYDTKVKQAQKFLSKGAKVKLTMTFSGREMRFKDQGKEMMLKLIEELSSSSKMEAPLSLRPSNFSVTLVPLK